MRGDRVKYCGLRASETARLAVGWAVRRRLMPLAVPNNKGTLKLALKCNPGTTDYSFSTQNPNIRLSGGYSSNWVV